MIRVLIAEDMHMIRGALVALLSLEEDMEVVAELERGDQIVEAALRTRPDVAVVDIDLPGLDGLTAAEQRVLAVQEIEAVWDVLESLSDNQRTVFLLHFMEEMDSSEIEAVTGIARGAVKVHLFRAVHAVREKLRSPE